MKAQQLRDKLAGTRDFTVLVDEKEIEEVAIDIAKRTIYITSKATAKDKPEMQPAAPIQTQAVAGKVGK